MPILGRNLYIDGVKFNDTLVPLGESFTFDGLASGVGYHITATNVDAAGNESVQSPVLTASTSVPVPVGGPLPLADRTAVDAIVQATMTASGIPGAQISITGPKGFYTKAYGTTGARPVTTDDHFRMGSVTKTFTSTAVLQQVEQGTISLDDTLDQFDTATTILSTVPNASTITIRHMLMMRSGVFDYLTDAATMQTFALSPASGWSSASALAIIKRPGRFAPGTGYQYTNSNFVLLGLCLEAVTGRTIKQILTEDVIIPAGLTETVWPPNSNIPLPFVNGYGASWLHSIPIIGFLFPATADQTIYNPELFGAAGALTSTIGDLHLWGQHMRDGLLLSRDSHELRMDTFTNQPQALDAGTGPNSFGYGLGFISFGSWFGHDGSVPGYECSTMFEPATGAVISVMGTYQTPALMSFSRTFHRVADYLYPGTIDTTPDWSIPRVVVRPQAVELSASGGTPGVNVVEVGAALPAEASLSVSGDTPTVSLSDNKISTPTGVEMHVIGGSDEGYVEPAEATLSATGGTPVVGIAAAFVPSNIENTDVTAGTAIPANAKEWRYTAIGPGGPGGAGRKNSVADNLRTGGGGGGGGAKVSTPWLPVALLGPTYSVTRGVRGVGGAPSLSNGNGGAGIVGTACKFVSGSVTLSAGPGGAGTGGQNNSGGAAGAGGTGSATGATATIANGTAGTFGQSSLTPNAAPGNTSGGGGGGGGGGGTSANDARRAGGGGGSSATQAGGAGGGIGVSGGNTTATAAGVAGAGSGGGGSTASGAIVKGGLALGYGGGGGGGGAAKSTSANTGGDSGGPSYSNIEWR